MTTHDIMSVEFWLFTTAGKITSKNDSWNEYYRNIIINPRGYHNFINYYYYYSLFISHSHFSLPCDMLYYLYFTIHYVGYHNRININVGCLRLLSFTWVAFTQCSYNCLNLRVYKYTLLANIFFFYFFLFLWLLTSCMFYSKLRSKIFTYN